MENPYFHRTPIRDSKFFFGRTAETRKVMNYVSVKQPVSIVGPRRIGKTSLLFHLRDPKVKAKHRLGDDYVFVYVDCQELSGDLTKSDVYRKLLEDAIKAKQGGHGAEYGSRESMTGYIHNFLEEGMSGIPPDIYKQLRTTLLNCDPFASDSELGAVFVDARISPWRNRLPKASNPDGRVRAVIHFLHNQYNDAQENALVLLLRVLSEQVDPGDACHQYLAVLASELERTIKSTGITEIESVKRPVQTLPQRLNTPPITYLDFERRLDEITAPDLQVVFLFDEFEAIADNRRLGKDFFTELRGLGETGKVVYVTASGQTLFDLSFHDENVLSSPFFNSFYTVWLGFMKPREAIAMVDGLAAMTNSEGFDENDHTFLREIAGLHPFYLQVACYCLFEEKMEQASSTTPEYDRVKRQFAQELQGHFQYTWKCLSDGEKWTLKLIDEGLLDKVAAEDIGRLAQKCLVYQGKIFSSAFAEFVRQPVTKTEVRDAHGVNTRDNRQATVNYRSEIDELEDQVTRTIDLLDQHKGVEGVVRIQVRLKNELATLETDRIQLIELEVSLSPGNPLRADAFRRLIKDVQRIKYYMHFEIGSQLRELGIQMDDIGNRSVA